MEVARKVEGEVDDAHLPKHLHVQLARELDVERLADVLYKISSSLLRTCKQTWRN